MARYFSEEPSRASERVGSLRATSLDPTRSERPVKPRASRTERDLARCFSEEPSRASERVGSLRAKPSDQARRDVRVVEGARLESVCRGNSTEGSNPSLSANFAPLVRRSESACGVGQAFGSASPRRPNPQIPPPTSLPSYGGARALAGSVRPSAPPRPDDRIPRYPRQLHSPRTAERADSLSF